MCEAWHEAISRHPPKRRRSDLPVLPDKRRHSAEELMRKVGTETDQLRVMFVDRETHPAVLDSKARRLHRHQELHRSRMDYFRCEFGIVSAHGETIIEFSCQGLVSPSRKGTTSAS